MPADVLAPIIVSVVIGLLLQLFQWAIGKATPVRPGERRLPALFAAAGILSGAFAGLVFGAGLIGKMSPARDDYPAWLAIWVCFLAAGLYLVIASGNWRLWMRAEGFQIRNELGVLRPFAPWSEITRVSQTWTSVVAFELRAGGALKIPFGTSGLIDAIRSAHAHGAAVEHALLVEVGLEEA